MPQVRCPTCDQPFEYEQSSSRPFCSERCQQVDLANWLDEKYGVPYERIDDDYEGEDVEAAENGV